MPELPEVESLRRSLEPALLNAPIGCVHIDRRDVVSGPGDPPGGFSRSRTGASPTTLRRAWTLEGDRIASLTRHGKQLAIVGDSGSAIVVQLGMTGSLRVLEPGDMPPAHTHVRWELPESRTLAFCDPRRFGLVRLLPEGTRDAWAALGPDALTVRAPALHAQLAHTTRAIKAALLDQSVIAGVGNIYADEALFASRVHPACPADRLDQASVTRLGREIRSVLRRAIRGGGSTIRDYRNGSGETGRFQGSHRVYGRGGQPCLICRTPLERIQLAQRTTVYCAGCQGPVPGIR